MKNERRLKIPKKVRTCFGVGCSISGNCLRYRLVSVKHCPNEEGRICKPGSFYPEYVPDNFPKGVDPEKDIPDLTDQVYELVEVGLEKIQHEGYWIGKDLEVGEDGRLRLPAGLKLCRGLYCKESSKCLCNRLHRDFSGYSNGYEAADIDLCVDYRLYLPDRFPADLNLYMIKYWSEEVYLENEQNILDLYDNNQSS